MTEPVEDLARDGIAPIAVLTQGVIVRIERDQADKWRKFRDDGTIQAFMRWHIDAEVFPFSGFTSVGPGLYSSVFPMEHLEKIEAWLAERGTETHG